MRRFLFLLGQLAKLDLAMASAKIPTVVGEVYFPIQRFMTTCT